MFAKSPRPCIPAIQFDNGYMQLTDILSLTKISPQAWRYGLTVGKYPQPSIRDRLKGDMWKVSDIRALLTRL